MSALEVTPPFPVFADIDGQPLEAGYVWLGTANLDPQTNPITVYWDAALTILAPQPIRTLAGYPSNNGTPARLYVNSDYSIRVMNKNGSTVYSAPAATERYSDEVISAVNAVDVFYEPAGTSALPTNVQSKLRETVSVFDFMTAAQIADVKSGAFTLDVTSAVQTAINSAASLGPSNYPGANIYFPAGRYKITSTLTVPTNAPTQAFISFYGEGSPSNLEWAGATDAPTLFFPHSSDRMHIFVDKLNFTGENLGGGVFRGIGIRFGTPATPSGFVVNFSVTNCKFNILSTCIEAHGESDLALIQKNYIGGFSTAGIKYFQSNCSGWQIIANHFRSGQVGSTCIIGDSTGNGSSWLITGNVLQSATGKGILSMRNITNVTVLNNYCENSGAGLLGDLSPFIFTNCRNVTLEDNLTTGRTGLGAIIQLLGTTQSVRIGNNYHGISAGTPVGWLFIDATASNVSLLGNLTTNGAIALFASGSSEVIDLIYKQENPDGEFFNKALAPVNETNRRQNAPAAGAITLKTLGTTSAQAYYVYALNSFDNIWSYGIVSRAYSNAPEFVSLYQKSADLVISISGDDVIVTNGIGTTRTIRYSLTRIY